VTFSSPPQRPLTAFYDDSAAGLVPGTCIVMDVGGPNEEYTKVIIADPENQTFDAVVL